MRVKSSDLQAQFLRLKARREAKKTVLAVNGSRREKWSAPRSWYSTPFLGHVIGGGAHGGGEPKLLSVTFYGLPPGTHDADNSDDPDDIDVRKKGFTTVDPRWGRHDPVRKLVELPLRDAAARNIGEIVVVYKNPHHGAKAESRYEQRSFLAAIELCNRLEKKILTYAGLCALAK